MSRNELELRVVQYIARKYKNYTPMQMVDILKRVNVYVNKNGLPKNKKEFKNIIKLIDKHFKELGVKKDNSRNIEYRVNVDKLDNYRFGWELIEKRRDNTWCNAGAGVSNNRENALRNAFDFASIILN